MRRGMIGGGIGEASYLLRGKLSTAIMRYPTGRYGIVGSIPIELTEEYRSGFTVGRTSRTYETEQDAIQALLGVGVTSFQLSDCSWYKG
jgi:hypothetical protein